MPAVFVLFATAFLYIVLELAAVLNIKKSAASASLPVCLCHAWLIQSFCTPNTLVRGIPGPPLRPSWIQSIVGLRVDISRKFSVLRPQSTSVFPRDTKPTEYRDSRFNYFIKPTFL